VPGLFTAQRRRVAFQGGVLLLACTGLTGCRRSDSALDAFVSAMPAEQHTYLDCLQFGRELKTYLQELKLGEYVGDVGFLLKNRKGQVKASISRAARQLGWTGSNTKSGWFVVPPVSRFGGLQETELGSWWSPAFPDTVYLIYGANEDTDFSSGCVAKIRLNTPGKNNLQFGALRES